jgi:8-oxo-dGTP diphosphatase
MGQDLNMVFGGAKIALYLGDQLVVILRDDFEGLAYAGCWDLPGGGREGTETPLACVQRECFEELGLEVPQAAIGWHRSFVQNGVMNWFFVGHLPAACADRIVLGDEGQRWALMSDQAYIDHDTAIPIFQERLRVFLERAFDGERTPRYDAGGGDELQEEPVRRGVSPK